MIEKIITNSVSTKNNNTKNQPQFKGGPIDLAVTGLQLCEQNPMLNVTVLDLSTAIIPRTAIEAQTNPYAGLEALRRESSGLVINCLIPGFIVAGFAKLLQKGVMGKNTDMASCWANNDTIELITKHWENAQNDAIIQGGKEIFAKGNDAKIYNTFKNLLKDSYGMDGKKEVLFSEEKFAPYIEDCAKELTNEIINPKQKIGIFSDEWFKKRAEVKQAKQNAKKAGKTYVPEKSAYEKLIEVTNVAGNIKNKKHFTIDKETNKVVYEYLDQSLGDIKNGAKKILKELKSRNDGSKVVEDIAKEFKHKASNLVLAKSALGLGVIIPLALAAQPINRWITKKTSGKDGAPIYKDFEQSKGKELSGKEKAALARQKMISVSSIIGVALLSIMKKPSWAMLKGIVQFKGIFPSMDQARLISTVTFASRMMSSQDKNDLREATSRDIATFCAFYFLGDYVAKGFATLIQKIKPDLKLINVLKETPKDANILKRFWYWAKHTALKNSDELNVIKETPELTAKATKYAKKMRGICQLGNIGFSLVALGLVIPKMYRKKTDQEHEKELKLQKMVNK